MQAICMTTKSNHHPVYNYRTDYRHEEGNNCVPYGHRYRTADDIEIKLGVNDGSLLRYIPSATEETIQQCQP